MTIRRDKVIIVDVEATCWPHDPPEGQINEIIEVGICLFDMKSGDLTDKQSIFVKPEKSEVSEFCTRLTTITPEQANNGLSFHLACTILEREYDSRNRLWASWGDYDRRMFKDQCKDRRIRYPFSDKHVNIKRLFADLNSGQRVGMAQALHLISLELQGIHHRGDDDAWNIGRILHHLVQTHSDTILLKYW